MLSQSLIYTLPAGRYYVGDPCYVLHDKWDAVGDQSNGFADQTIVAQFDGRKMVAFGTAYGDGRYRDNRGNEYSVDAGLIGAVPVEMIHPDELVGTEGYSHLFTFERDFRCYERDGVIHIQNIRINTAENGE